MVRDVQLDSRDARRRRKPVHDIRSHSVLAAGTLCDGERLRRIIVGTFSTAHELTRARSRDARRKPIHHIRSHSVLAVGTLRDGRRAVQQAVLKKECSAGGGHDVDGALVHFGICAEPRGSSFETLIQINYAGQHARLARGGAVGRVVGVLREALACVVAVEAEHRIDTDGNLAAQHGRHEQLEPVPHHRCTCLILPDNPVVVADVRHHDGVVIQRSHSCWHVSTRFGGADQLLTLAAIEYGGHHHCKFTCVLGHRRRDLLSCGRLHDFSRTEGTLPLARARHFTMRLHGSLNECVDCGIGGGYIALTAQVLQHSSDDGFVAPRVLLEYGRLDARSEGSISSEAVNDEF